MVWKSRLSSFPYASFIVITYINQIIECQNFQHYCPHGEITYEHRTHTTSSRYYLWASLGLLQSMSFLIFLFWNVMSCSLVLFNRGMGCVCVWGGGQ